MNPSEDFEHECSHRLKMDLAPRWESFARNKELESIEPELELRVSYRLKLELIPEIG